MNFALGNLIYTIGLLLGMLFLLEVGRRVGLRRMAVDKEGARAGIGTVEGALLALLGLLIAFSFSGAAARFDARRRQIDWGVGCIDPEKYEQAVKAGRVEQDIPVNHSEFFAPVIEPTLSAGTQALVVAALTYLAK